MIRNNASASLLSPMTKYETRGQTPWPPDSAQLVFVLTPSNTIVEMILPSMKIATLINRLRAHLHLAERNTLWLSLRTKPLRSDGLFQDYSINTYDLIVLHISLPGGVHTPNNSRPAPVTPEGIPRTIIGDGVENCQEPKPATTSPPSQHLTPGTAIRALEPKSPGTDLPSERETFLRTRTSAQLHKLNQPLNFLSNDNPQSYAFLLHGQKFPFSTSSSRTVQATIDQIPDIVSTCKGIVF
jgi:hypothetical protein